jgi:hypothetical protein
MKKARAKERKADKEELDKALAELSVKYAPLSGPVKPLLHTEAFATT